MDAPPPPPPMTTTDITDIYKTTSGAGMQLLILYYSPKWSRRRVAGLSTENSECAALKE